jgi:glycerophosphoryl diester phosphodiesterase
VIAHRGASARRPEHTLAAYRLAIEEGADFVEPDLVVTRDGMLIARHENALSGTTDVASRPEFARRRTTKVIDGETVTDWFAEDFTLAEIKRLRAREPLPEVRPGSAAFDGRFEIPTLAEIIALVRSVEAGGGPRVGIYPETKHPTFFAREGRHLDGGPIGVDLGEQLVATLKAEGFTDPARVFIQSFELANLIDLKRRVLPAAGLDLPLIQLFGDTGDRFVNDAGGGFSRPYDVGYHARRGDDLAAIYGPDLAARLGPHTGYGDLMRPEALALIARYARGIGPWAASLLPRVALGSPVDADGDRRAGIATRLTGEVSPLGARARAAGLLVHAYTLRPEEPFRTLDAQGRVLTMAGEIAALVATGVDGVFSDDPAGAVRAVREVLGAD